MIRVFIIVVATAILVPSVLQAFWELSKYAKDTSLPPVNITLTLKQQSGTLAHKRALVVGGSSGIGRGISIALAEAGASVLVVGRNPSRGKATVEAMEEASRSSNKMQSFEYRSADLSTIKACLNFIIQLQVGERKTEPFDFLVLTLGVWPNWKEPISSEGLDKVVAVDLVARYLLMTKVPLKPNARVMSVLASGRWVGQPSLDTFKAMITGSTPVTPFTWASKMMGTLALSADALLLKAASQSHQSQPGIRFIGTHPGIVDTDLSVNTIPKWMHDIVFAVLKMMGMTVTQSQTGTVHALILGSPQLGQVSQRASFWTEDGVARQTHPMAYDQEVQDWLWHFLLQTVNRLSTVHDVDNTPQ